MKLLHWMPAAAALLSLLLPARADAQCAHLPYQFASAPGDTQVPVAASFEAFFPPVKGKDDFEYKTKPVQASLKFKTITVGPQAVLHHSSAHDIQQIMVMSDGRKLKTWFTPNPCQSLLHSCMRQGDATAFDYQFRVKQGQHLKLLLIEGGRYPLLGDDGHFGYTDNLQGTPSNQYTGNDKAITEFCTFASKFGIDGWRQPNDQDEIMLCPQTEPYKRLEQVAKLQYECIAPGDAPRPMSEDNELKFGRDSSGKCSGIKGQGNSSPQGHLSDQQLTDLAMNAKGIQWIKVDDKTIEMTSSFACTTAGAPTFTCACALESEVAPPRPNTPPPARPARQKKGMFKKLKDFFMGD